MDPIAWLFEDPSLAADPIARELAAVLCAPSGRSSGGWPYLGRPAWERLRDWVPHILDAGPRVLDALERVHTAAPGDIDGPARVVRRVVGTAAITAPPDLWLVAHVLRAWHELGLLAPLVAGEVLDPGATDLQVDSLTIDADLLLARGYLVRAGAGYRVADHGVARDVIARAGTLPEPPSTDAWIAALTGAAAPRVPALPDASAPEPPTWVAGLRAIATASQLVPLVLGLRRSGRRDDLLAGEPLTLEPALRVLVAAGACTPSGALTVPGRRVLERGPGPFGIIEAYHPYMTRLVALHRGAGAVWVERADNVSASRDANARSFARANDALDRFCSDTGFTYEVFVEHAIGHGEATRQRRERSGDGLRYFGADLEDAAIDAAAAEVEAGRLPPHMVLVRGADIGRPEVLIEAMRRADADPEGAVMLVGNGFHEVRNQSDARMVEVFRGYERAGLVLLFTEESALEVDDLLATAWNTYHAGFRYVHARSGQGLRPAVDTPPSRFGGSLPTSWTTCATRAGYVRAHAWCTRSRTIYPFPPANGHNPSISVNHFLVPERIARRLGLG